MEFLRIIEIAISCQGDREESIRPDGNFEIRVEQASSAEIFQTEFEFFTFWHTCEYAYAWKFDSCSSYYFPPSPEESSPFRSLIRKRVAWKVVRSIDSSRREKKKTIYRSKIIIYSAFVKFVLSLTSHGAFCINKIAISTKMPCVSRLATLRGKK